VFLAVVICLVGSERTANPLRPSGPNLSSSQLVVTAGRSPSPGMMMPLTSAQEASLGRRLNNLAVSLHARFVVPLEFAGTLSVAGVPQGSNKNFAGSVYVATPQLLATYGIKASQIAPGTDFLTARPGLAGLSHMDMTWQSSGNGGESDGGSGPSANGGPSCTLSNDCLASPAIQTVSSLPGGTDAPNTVITEYAVRKYHQIALGVLAASVGLIRSETAPDLRTLTATGASTSTRRTITAATAAALGLLGALLGTAFAVLASLVWAHGSLSAMFGDVPVADVLTLLVGLPLVAAAGGWLLAGREPQVIARQPLD
jgi:putative ABC transport system permease protein